METIPERADEGKPSMKALLSPRSTCHWPALLSSSPCLSDAHWYNGSSLLDLFHIDDQENYLFMISISSTRECGMDSIIDFGPG